MSSNLTPAQRTEAVNKFRMGETWVLICTDLMSRGIDFKGVNLVVNFDFPQSANSYIHRIGRTGRAGRKGKAITYFTSAVCSACPPAVHTSVLAIVDCW